VFKVSDSEKDGAVNQLCIPLAEVLFVSLYDVLRSFDWLEGGKVEEEGSGGYEVGREGRTGRGMVGEEGGGKR